MSTEPKAIAVRIRVASEPNGSGAHLCDYNPTFIEQLDDLVEAIKRWGVESDSNCYGVTGGFVLRDGKAYFEIVIHDTDDAG